MKCANFMVNDWIGTNNFPMQVTTVGEDYLYANFEGNEGDIFEFDDKEDCQPDAIVLTKEILNKNGWIKKEDGYNLWYIRKEKPRCLITINTAKQFSPLMNTIDGYKSIKYVHELQQLLRLVKLNEFANNFKI